MKKVIKFIFILFIFYISAVPVFGEKNRELSIASGVVPHHMLAKEIIVDFFEFVAEQEPHPETILLLSPDHFNSSMLNQDTSFITVHWETGNKNILEIPVDVSLLKKLSINHSIKQNHGAILSEFGLTNLLPLIKKFLPETKIVPLLMPEDISREQVESLVHSLHEISSPDTIMIASVDFSHYLPPEAAEFHDRKSIRVLLNFEEENFKNIEVDSWQSLYAVRLFAKLRESENPTIIAHKNSIDFLPYDLNSTTSYFSVIFQQGKPVENLKAETILLAGDMMLGRGIEELLKQNSVYYPFQEIVQLLRGVDIVFANLEGPVLENPLEFTGDELKFSFHSNVLEGVNWSQINLLSLANNHTLDMGKEGLKETKDWLKEYQIHFIGNPLPGYQDIKNTSFATVRSIFLAFNRILPFVNYQKEMIEEIKKVKLHNPEKYIIVSMHWGNEYELTSSPAQRELAHQIMAAGADLIVGHHPHVVQEIELIQGKPVFYSLGNFIFDHQGLPETREGFLVGLTVEPDRISYRLFPIQNPLGQPRLMKSAEAEIFLKKLAGKSDKSLWEKIEKGIIEINRKN
jgi:AmmeMemoRadiSam system protein B